jgi:preprotein translocase subunit SecA
MDELRRGIGLRAIGQKDPLLEYQFESFNLFQEMLQGVREKVTEYALRVAVVTENANGRRSRATREGRDTLLPGSRRMEEGEKEEGKPRIQPLRKGPKVGRNDPCPCGSGRKYKHCCGREQSSRGVKEQ